MHPFLRVLLLVSVAGAHALAQTPKAPPTRVVSTAGAWTNGTTLVIRGTQPDAGSELVTTAAGDLLIECDNGKQFLYSCKGGCRVKACRQDKSADVDVRELQVQPGFWQSLFAREPKQLVVAAARAGGNLSDAVLVQDARGVHWGPALSRVLEGRYCLRLASLTTSGSEQSGSVTIEWDRAVDPEGVAQAALKPGLYRAEKGTPAAGGTCQVDADGLPAWLLLTSANEFESVNAKWKQYQQSAGELERANAAPAIIATFRHAALASMADGSGTR